MTNKTVEWESNEISSVIFRPPWMFIIGSGLLEIRDLASGRLEQLVSMLDNVQTMWDGRDLGLGCGETDHCLHVSARSKHDSRDLDSNDGSVCLFEIVATTVP